MVMTPDVDIESLRLLIAVADEGSLTAAAARVGISQPAASARVREFEARWKLSVVRRTPRGSTLTTDGRAVVTWARAVIHEVDIMRAGLASLTDERRSELTVGASLTIAEFLLPRWLGELKVRMPGVHPRLHVVNSDRVADMVREDLADVGFIETAARPIDLEHRVVGADKLIVIVPAGHPWARRQYPIDIDTLGRAQWVMREQGSGTRSTFEAALRSEPLVALESSSTATLVGAVAAGVGPGVVSARAVLTELETRRLVEVRTDLELSRPLTAIWRRGQRMPPAVGELLAIATDSSRRFSG